jgi:hypothetical protein
MKAYLFKSIIILSGLLLISDPVYPQKYPNSRFELSGGFGWPEMGALKIKYGKNFQVGISQGFMLNTSVEVYYHFTGKPRFTDRKVWYGLGGLEYLYWGMEEPNWFPYLRLGRTFNLSGRYGLNLDLGAFYLLHRSDFFSGSRYSPSGSFSFFIRL